MGTRAARRHAIRLTSGTPIHRSVDKENSSMAKVEIYTKMFCPYCTRAKKLLESKGVQFEEYDITLGGPKRSEMLERANGQTTVPQVFTDQRHIGEIGRAH